MNMNYRQLVVMMPLVGLIAQGAIADESKIDKKLAKEAPLFERIKLRGALRDDVSRDVIEQKPGEGYQPRVVQWWPKKGNRLHPSASRFSKGLGDFQVFWCKDLGVCG